MRCAHGPTKIPMRKSLLLFTALIFCVFTVTAQAAHLVFLIGEDEYYAWETLPEFAKKDLDPLGHRITILQSDEANKNHFPGIVEAPGWALGATAATKGTAE